MAELETTDNEPTEKPADATPPDGDEQPRRGRGRPKNSPNKPKGEPIDGAAPVKQRRKAPADIEDTLAGIKSRHAELNELIAHHNEKHPETKIHAYPEPGEQPVKGEPKFDGDAVGGMITALAAGTYMATVALRGKSLDEPGRELRLNSAQIEKASSAWVEWSCYIAPGAVNPQTMALFSALTATTQIVASSVMQGVSDPDPRAPTTIRDVAEAQNEA